MAVCVQACPATQCVYSFESLLVMSPAAVTNHFTGQWQRAGAHLEAARSLLNDSSAAAQDSPDPLCAVTPEELCNPRIRQRFTLRQGRDGMGTEELCRAE